MDVRSWTLGDDLRPEDNLLDGITFDEIILTVHCNCRNITAEIMKIPEQRTENRQALRACRTHNKGGYIMKTYRIECVNLKKDWKSGHVGTTVKTGFAEVKKFMYPTNRK
jgi:hypothetical protein|nr:MAG TPA: hypothetical protein [Caudoviricetes sp.]